MNPNFKVPFVDWPKRFLESLGPMMPSAGAKTPWSFATYVLYAKFVTSDQDFWTFGAYQAYLAEWGVEWTALNPNTPVPAPA